MSDADQTMNKKHLSLIIFLIGSVGETVILKKVTLNAFFPAALSFLTASTGVLAYTSIAGVALIAGWKTMAQVIVPWWKPAFVAVLWALHHILLNVGAGHKLVPGILVVVLLKAVIPMSMLMNMQKQTLGLQYGPTHWAALCVLLVGIVVTVWGEIMKHVPGSGVTLQLLFCSLLIVISTFPLAASFTFIEISLTQAHTDLFTVALWAYICCFQVAMTLCFLPLSAKLTGLPFSKIGSDLRDGAGCYLLGESNGSPDGVGCPEAAKYWWAAIVCALMYNLAMPVCTKLAGATMMWFVRSLAVPLCGLMFASQTIMGTNAADPSWCQALGLVLVAAGVYIYNMKKPKTRKEQELAPSSQDLEQKLLETPPSNERGCLGSVAVFFFNLCLVLCTLPSYIVAKCCCCCGPARDGSFRQKCVFVLTSVAWRCVFAFSCWIRRDVDGLQQFRAELKASSTGAVLIANHLCFLDTIILVALMPLSKIASVKMFVSSHLLKIPLLRTIVKAMGHLVVPFKSSAEGKFEVDKDLMAKRQEMLEAHVKEGGIAGWFPEGTMNSGVDTLKVAQFRAGGFSLAVNVDVPIWCVAFVGNDRCWPKSAAVGGRPSRIGMKMFKLCDHSKELAAKAGSSQRGQQVHLANFAHQKIQEAVDELSAQGGHNAS